MLVLSRKVNENIVIDGRIVVKVVRTEGNFVKLGIEAPADVPVHRQEVYDEIQRNNQAALTKGPPPGRVAAAPNAAAKAPAAAQSNPQPTPPTTPTESS
jgi:carbon storage regulator